MANAENHWNTLKTCLLGQTTKQPLSNFEPRKSWKYKQLEGWGLTLVTYIYIFKKCISISWPSFMSRWITIENKYLKRYLTSSAITHYGITTIEAEIFFQKYDIGFKFASCCVN